MKGHKPILLLEDDEVDTMNVQRAFKELNIVNRLDCCVDGEVGLNYLYEEGREMPCIILLDLNMPKMNGIEFLKNIKQEDSLKRIPVVVLTTSKEEKDKVDSYNLGVAGYMLKPVDYTQFVDVVRQIDIYWSLSETTS